MTPCMGGWCQQRERCANYQSAGQSPSERLCERGSDGKSKDAFIVIRGPVWKSDGIQRVSSVWALAS